MDYFVWDVDPILFQFGPIQIRYYGLCFALVLLVGFHFVKQALTRMGYPEEKIYPYFYILTIFGIIGARVGHCVFYEPARYFSNPIEILYIWKGGLASHGGTLGILFGTIFHSWYTKTPWLVIADVSAYAAACAAFFVRVGNFFNSEIVGRVTDVPWAMYFPRSWKGADYPRHPSQLYEAAMGLIILLIIYFVERKLGPKRPRGLLIGILLVLYFSGRFFVEFFKEYQTLSPNSMLTMGQILSIIPFLSGFVFLGIAWKDRGRLTGATEPDMYKPETDKKVAGRNKKRK